jgi:hypothetical protein
VEADIVDKAEEYLYSSAGDYFHGKKYWIFGSGIPVKNYP